MTSRRQVLAAAAAIASARAAQAQNAWPDRPIRVIVPFAAGGNADTIGRILQPRLQERLGQPVVVENRPGAGGGVGAMTKTPLAERSSMRDPSRIESPPA